MPLDLMTSHTFKLEYTRLIFHNAQYTYLLSFYWIMPTCQSRKHGSFSKWSWFGCYCWGTWLYHPCRSCSNDWLTSASGEEVYTQSAVESYMGALVLHCYNTLVMCICFTKNTMIHKLSVGEMLWCVLLVYAEQAKTKVVTTRSNKTEATPVQTAAAVDPSPRPHQAPLADHSSTKAAPT